MYISLVEFEGVKVLVYCLVEEKCVLKEEEFVLLCKDCMVVDIVMFGWMLVEKIDFNVEVVCQVVYVFGVSEMIVEDDFFIVVDDLCQVLVEDVGVGYFGEIGFGFVLFYIYICINKDLLVKNLNDNEELVNKMLCVFIEVVLKVLLIGK